VSSRAVFWLRLSYWAGAALDALAGLTMVFPGLFATLNRPAAFHPGPDYRYAMGMGAPLMFGWTALLLWADRKPLERQGLLLITVLVMVGLAVNEASGLAAGFVPLAALLPTFVIQCALAALFLFAYLKVRKAA
jgi:hypothetical protein